jgi:nitrite reductase/ring-hydroxylating ferredoxin subunit
VSCGPALWMAEGALLRVPIIPGFVVEDPELGRIAARGALIARKNGQIRAYVNVCRHVPLSLDLGDGEVASADGRYFLCHHHGARYQVDDGVCIYGPCEGESLIPLASEVVDGELFVLVPG